MSNARQPASAETPSGPAASASRAATRCCGRSRAPRRPRPRRAGAIGQCDLADPAVALDRLHLDPGAEIDAVGALQIGGDLPDHVAERTGQRSPTPLDERDVQPELAAHGCHLRTREPTADHQHARGSRRAAPAALLRRCSSGRTPPRRVPPRRGPATGGCAPPWRSPRGRSRPCGRRRAAPAAPRDRGPSRRHPATTRRHRDHGAWAGPSRVPERSRPAPASRAAAGRTAAALRHR